MSDDGQGSHKEQPIIIKKVKKGGHGGHHGGAWKVAYADFVTAMMAFFIVMWILASSAEVKEQVSGYFQEPGVFTYESGKNAVPVKIDIMPATKSGQGAGQGPGEGAGQGPGQGGMSIAFSSVKEQDSLISAVSDKLKMKALIDSVKAHENIKKMGDELKQQLINQIAQRPEMREILSSIKIEMTKEGLRIELIESKDALFFQVGSAKLSAAAMDILKQLGERIAAFPNNVELEGHTDARQYGKNASYTNWELSNDRANAARRVLTNYLWSGQIDKVTGFADRRLRTPTNPFDINNRRISILIKQLSATDFLKETQQQIEGEAGNE